MSLLPKWIAEREINLCICFEEDFDDYSLLIDRLPPKSKISLTVMATKEDLTPKLNVSISKEITNERFDKSGGRIFTGSSQS